MNMKTNRTASGKVKFGLACAGVVLFVGITACLAEIFSDRAIPYEYEYAIDEGTWVQNALRERQIVAESSQLVTIPAYGSQSNRLKDMKSILRGVIPAFVDNTKTSGDFLDWFSAPTGTTAEGCGVYPDRFPLHTVTGLLAHVGAPTNYFEYTPWRPLDDQSFGEVTAQTAPGYTTTDYGWKYMRPILVNLKWTAEVSCSMTGRYTRANGYGLHGASHMDTYGTGSSSYSLDGEDDDSLWYPLSMVYPYGGEEDDQFNFSSCLNIEAFKSTYTLNKNSSGSKVGEGGFTWQETGEVEISEHYRKYATATISNSWKVPLGGEIDLYLIRTGVPYVFSVEATSSGGFGTGEDYCGDSETNIEESDCWQTASDMARAEIIESRTFASSAKYSFVKTGVALNPPDLNALTELSETASAQSSTSCTVGELSCSYTETIAKTEKRWYYKARIQPGFLFKWSFDYN